MLKLIQRNFIFKNQVRYFSGKIIKLKDSGELKEIIKNSETPVMVDFYADWCGPCKSLGPKLEESAKEKNFTLVKVNVDNHAELSEEYDVSGIPHVILFKGGKKESSFVGNNPGALENMKKLI